MKWLKATALVAALTLSADVIAAADSAGGSIGQRNKSISGSNERSRPVKKPSMPKSDVRTGAGKYVGCYRDNWVARDLSGYESTGAGMSSAICIQICSDHQFTYAGTEYGGECRCGNSYGREGKADNCDTPCSGKPDEKCGGFLANSVYRVK